MARQVRFLRAFGSSLKVHCITMIAELRLSPTRTPHVHDNFRQTAGPPQTAVFGPNFTPLLKLEPGFVSWCKLSAEHIAWATF
jgi:hypothetical protein